jgi:hypothetical protein
LGRAGSAGEGQLAGVDLLPAHPVAVGERVLAWLVEEAIPVAGTLAAVGHERTAAFTCWVSDPLEPSPCRSRCHPPWTGSTRTLPSSSSPWCTRTGPKY